MYIEHDTNSCEHKEQRNLSLLGVKRNLINLVIRIFPLKTIELIKLGYTDQLYMDERGILLKKKQRNNKKKQFQPTKEEIENKCMRCDMEMET